mmetsp:Transcript_82264/g.220791  ORF Transcript_82264/g.220791 Transcript_82264/m.220791 type:complete len:285 (-) Transcript_82264:190-1044(-)
MNNDSPEVQEIYVWVDQVPLSRPKRNIARDFSDAVLAAEVIHFFYPKLVEMHNYSAANSNSQKMYNWQTLNKRVLSRLKITLTHSEIEALATSQPMAVEALLIRLKQRIDDDKSRLHSGNGFHSPSDGNIFEFSSILVSLEGAEAPTSRESSRVTSRVTAERSNVGQENKRVSSVSGARTTSPPQVAQPRAWSAGASGLGSVSRKLEGSRPPSFGGMQVASPMQREVDTELLVEKEQTIQELRETVEILESKVKKMEQLLRIKDAKIEALTARLSAPAAPPLRQ